MWGYPRDNRKGAQLFPIEFLCRPHSSYMSGIQPHSRALLNIWSGNLSTICSFFLYCLTPSHFYSKMLVNLLHHRLDIIGTHTSLISLLCRFSCKRHPRIRSLNRIKWSTLSCLRHSIICSKLCQWEPLDPIILLMVYKHPEILLQTGIHSSPLSLRLWMKSC